MSTERLLELLRANGFRKGKFTLTSGRESDFFIDCKPVVLTAEGHARVGEAMLDAALELVGRPDAFAGVELGGCPLASAVAMTTYGRGEPVNAVYVRKAAKGHGTKKLLEGADGLPKGARLVVLEDTVTTGGSTLRAVEQIREAGYEVAGVVAIVDRSEGGAEAIHAAGLPFKSLFARVDFMGDETAA